MKDPTADPPTDLQNGNVPFLYPDPLYATEQINGAAFLYFPLLVVTTPSAPIAPWGFEVLSLIDQRDPPWASAFKSLVDVWAGSLQAYQATTHILEPLQRVVTVNLFYDADLVSVNHTRRLLKDLHFERKDLLGSVDFIVAAGDVARHLLLEVWLELEKDVEALYNHCERVFGRNQQEELLLSVYFTRLASLARFSGQDSGLIMLSNPQLVPFFSQLGATLGPHDRDQGKKHSPKRRPIEFAVQQDVITYELFRQILAPYLDPIVPPTVELLADCIELRQEEIKALRQKCERLAHELGTVDHLEDLPEVAEDFIRRHVADEVANLLRLGIAAKEQFINSLLTDKTTWMTGLTSVWGLLHSSEVISLAGAIGALSTVGATTAKALLERHKQLRSSDYRLVYRLAK